ncbi:hypothetical protein OG427_35235 [Streptomyces sp. NBC_00133]|uniref:hypothetical protein n=1 Tax=Streptomyces sp. NBC_00133 TaxID=2903624 RepID=UPI003249E033
MAVIAVLIPIAMLGTVLALGRYEELLLPQKETSVDNATDRLRQPFGMPSLPAGVTVEEAAIAPDACSASPPIPR